MKSIHIAMPVSDFYGYGICGKYLLKEFSSRMPTYYYNCGGESLVDDNTKRLMEELCLPISGDIPSLQVTGHDFEPISPRGNPTAVYIFSEWEPITDKQKENLKAFDILIAGSEWNAKVIRDAGFKCHAVPQGVDRSVFSPQTRYRDDRFVIFSGGKWEHRKAQDLVIRAVKVLQQRHDDIVLMASWFNIWDNQDYYKEARREIPNLIGLAPSDQASLATCMNQTDVGLFPNRCEGGTNLVMMEYMACGKTVVANTSTGQKDVLNSSYATCIAGTDENLVEQMVESVEFLYSHRPVLSLMGCAAGRAMNYWSWGKTADGITRAIG